MTGNPPSAGALCCAAAVAILAPLPLVALLFEGATGGMGNIFPLVLLFGVPIAAVHVLALFLPLYLVTARGEEMPWWGAAALGLACGGLPAFMVSGADPVVTTLFAGSGLVGSLAFWLTLMLART